MITEHYFQNRLGVSFASFWTAAFKAANYIYVRREVIKKLMG
jgi:hypothetical protein